MENIKQPEESSSVVQLSDEKNRHKIHCITIAGHIEGHSILPPDIKTTKYEHVLPELAAIEESPDILGLLVLLNTAGGDVEAGLAIAELIAGMKKPTVSLVLGGGHSIGVPLAVSAKHTLIASSAAMTIHPVRLSGLVVGAPQTFSYFQKIQQRIINFIVKHSNMSEDKIKSLMMETGELATDVGSVVGSEDAVNIGLCNEVGTLSDALSILHDMIDKNIQN